jgi:hypothetical protein
MSAKIFGIGGADVIQFLQAGVGAVARTLLSKLQSIGIDPFDFDAVGDGVADDATAIQAAIDHATSLLIGNSFIEVDLAGKTYGVGSTILLKAGVNLKNGGLIAVGDAWAITDPMISITSIEDSGLSKVFIDCQWKCAGVLRDSGKRSNIDKCTIQRFKTYGAKDTGTTQESKLTNSIIRQYVYGDTGFDASANRDADGLYVDTADSIYDNNVILYCLYPLHVTGTLNLFSNIHVYNGATADANENVAVRVDGGAAQNLFSNMYIDNGICQIENSFINTFSTVIFQHTAAGTNTIAFELIATEALETAAGFIASDVRFNGTYSTGKLVFSTSGTGSWSGTRKIQWHGCSDQAGNPVTYLAKWGDKAALSDAGNLNLNAGVYQVAGNQVIGARITGYGDFTNGAKTGFDATTATLPQVAAALAQLITDFKTHGSIGA